MHAHVCMITLLTLMSTAATFLNADKQEYQSFEEHLDIDSGVVTKFSKVIKQIDIQQSIYQQGNVYSVIINDNNHTVLTLDDAIQYTTFDAFAYSEMMAHVPMLSHPNPKKALIIGGGDGGILRELTRYSELDEIVICDIDKMVQDIAAPHFVEQAAAYSDPRVQSYYQDGAECIKQYTNHFDVIIIDSTDFYGVAQSLLREEFYRAINNALTANGIVVAQSESMWFHADLIVTMQTMLKTIFPFVTYYYAMVPTYPGGSIGFSFSTKIPNFAIAPRPVPAAFAPSLRYYTTAMHQASFALPPFITQQL